MADMSYLAVIERYHEFREPIRELLASIITGVTDSSLLHDQEAQRKALLSVRERYPFVQILYVLDEHGVQISEFAAGEGGEVSTRHDVGRGRDRRHRPYYQQAVAAEGSLSPSPTSPARTARSAFPVPCRSWTGREKRGISSST